MPPKKNNPWITIALITAILLLIFLVFYGNKSSMTHTPLPLPQDKKGGPAEVIP